MKEGVISPGERFNIEAVDIVEKAQKSVIFKENKLIQVW